MIHQPISVVSQCSLNAWLSGWLAEINADLREVVACYRHFATMCLKKVKYVDLYTNPRTLLFLLALELAASVMH